VEQTNPVKGKYGTLMAVKALNNQEVWAAGTSGVILHTSDGGAHWVREAEGLSNEMLYGIWVVNNREVYVTGNNRTLLKYGDVTGIDEQREQSGQITAFPNPATGKICLQSAGNRPVTSVDLYDISGRKLIHHELASIREVDLSGLEKGIYILEAYCDGCKSITRIIKQ